MRTPDFLAGSFAVFAALAVASTGKAADSYPTKVSPFETTDLAEAWIERDKSRVVTESEAGKWFRKPGPGRPGTRAEHRRHELGAPEPAGRL